MTPQFEAACIAALMLILQDHDEPFDTTDDAIRCYGRFRGTNFAVSNSDGEQFQLSPAQMEEFSEWWWSLDEEARHVVTIGVEATSPNSEDSCYELNMRFEHVRPMQDMVLNTLYEWSLLEMGI